MEMEDKLKLSCVPVEGLVHVDVTLSTEAQLSFNFGCFVQFT
jgi:hypothetical protein